MKTDAPRPEQVAELTRGISLPLPAVDEEYLLIIVETLVSVWAELLTRPNTKVLEQDEPSITALIEARLNTLRNENSLWEMLVSAAIRGREMISYDGSHLEKRPDLSLLLTTPRQPAFPLIIECKLIDTNTKPVRLYCNDGLARFINGDYAWYDRQAIMLAYVRDTSTIATSLMPHLSKHQNKKLDPFACEQLPEASEAEEVDLARSKHERAFCYIHQMQRIPGTIEVWHLWLSAQKT